MVRKARLCLNSTFWSNPSGGWKGPYGRLPWTFPAGHGFGFEEWLTANSVTNLFSWMTRDTRYRIAFIQAYRNQQPNFIAPLELFIIDGNRIRRIVGTIQSCRRLSPAESAAAFNLFNGNGVLAAMQGQITPVPAPFHIPLVPHLPLAGMGHNPEEIFNCCFQIADLALLRQPYPPANHNFHRYTILYN